MNEQQKKESGFDKNRPDMESNNKDMKFKRKRDTRNNDSSGTNGMHNSDSPNEGTSDAIGRTERKNYDGLWLAIM